MGSPAIYEAILEWCVWVPDDDGTEVAHLEGLEGHLSAVMEELGKLDDVYDPSIDLDLSEDRPVVTISMNVSAADGFAAVDCAHSLIVTAVTAAGGFLTQAWHSTAVESKAVNLFQDA